MVKYLLCLVLSLSCATVNPRDTKSPTDLIEIGDIDDLMVVLVSQQLDEVPDNSHVTLRIDSFGGSVMVGLELIQYVEDTKRTRGITTTCLVDSKAYSMGMVILQSGACDTRAMRMHSTLLAHRASGQVRGNAAELTDTAGLLRALDRAMVLMMAARMHMDPAELAARIGDGGMGWVMAADEALATGAVDLIK